MNCSCCFKPMTPKTFCQKRIYVFREASSPELTSQSFPGPWFQSRSFVPQRKWNLMLLVHQNTGKENHCGKNFFAVLISTLDRFDWANKKKSVIYTLSFGELLWMSWRPMRWSNKWLVFIKEREDCDTSTSHIYLENQ